MQPSLDLLENADTVLLHALDFPNWDYKRIMIRDKMQKAGFKVLYAPEEEWALRAAGVINPLDSANHSILLDQGITHMLSISESSSRQGQLYTYETSCEISQQLNPYTPSQSFPDQHSSTVELMFQLYSLKTKQRYSLRVTTNIGGTEIRSEDGGRTTINAGGIDKARNVALKKGIQKILKDCR